MISPELFELVAQRIESGTALQFAGPRRRDLGEALARMARELDLEEDALAAWLLAGAWDARKEELCARYLTIPETYFFREPRGYELLCDYARRKLQAHPGVGLRLWSAGCCTGEEAYSMAITLRQWLPQLDPARVAILGTDLNPASLDAARAGEYGERAFRSTSPAMREAWFRQLGPGRWQIDSSVRAQVRFAQLNLALPVYPPATGGMDIIFCRNVLMYFSRSQMARVVARLRECLVEGGWLVVNPSEASSELFAGFSAHYHPDAVFYRKEAPDWKRASPPASLSAARLQPAPAARPAPRPAHDSMRPIPPSPRAESGIPVDTPAEVLRQARGMAGRGEHGCAYRVLLRAAGRWPLAAELYLAAGELALDQGRHDVARRHLQRHLYLEPESILGHYLSGVARMEEGSERAAQREFALCDELLDGLADDASVPGAEAWHADSLRASVRVWMERAT
jgi:chemotaxis protein methyltransferase CheR